MRSHCWLTFPAIAWLLGMFSESLSVRLLRQGQPVTAVLQMYALPFTALLLFTASFGGRPSLGAGKTKYELVTSQP